MFFARTLANYLAPAAPVESNGLFGKKMMKEASSSDNTAHMMNKQKKTKSKKLRQWMLSSVVGGNTNNKKKGPLSSSSSTSTHNVNQTKKKCVTQGITCYNNNNSNNNTVVRSSSSASSPAIIVADATVETCHSIRPVDESSTSGEEENDCYDDADEILVLRPADSFSTTCDDDAVGAITAARLPQVQIAEDDMSSVSIITTADPRRRYSTMVTPQQQQQQQQAMVQEEIPVMVFVPDNSYSSQRTGGVTSSSSIENENPAATIEQQQTTPQQDPIPRHSVIRTDRPLDLSSLESMVSKPIAELDPELRARLQAIQQLSSMMGANHPDVRFSMKYTSRLLYERGDFMGAQVLQDYIQNVPREMGR